LLQIESYHKLEKLGEGTYATVFKGISMYVGVNSVAPCLENVAFSRQWRKLYADQL
jgi:hypothetical protein